jgi:hypothetical protein
MALLAPIGCAQGIPQGRTTNKDLSFGQSREKDEEIVNKIICI